MNAKRRKRKLDEGGGLTEYAAPLGALGAMTDQLQALREKPSSGLGAAGGALKGAAAGAALGPLGIAGGAIIGGITGLATANKARKKQAELENLINTQTVQSEKLSAIQNSMRTGGRIKKKSQGLTVLRGGGLMPVSQDAVEVKANNPNQTDSVELEEAFVDHNEIIDRKDRVFSDDLMSPSGKSIAKEAKKLEKMKGNSPRFAASNVKIDKELDALFEYQEKQKLAHGGTLDRTGKLKTKKAYGGDLASRTGRKKKKAQFGIPDLTADTNYDGLRDDGFGDLANRRTNIFDKFGQGLQDANITPQKILTTAATFGPNILAESLRRKLKAPQSPSKEGSVSLDRISPRQQLATANRAFGSAQDLVKSTTGSAGNTASAAGSLLAKRLEAENQIYGQVNNQNIGIGNQEAYINQSINARNVERTNRYKDDITNFQNKKLMLQSENAANLSDKILQQGRERNLRIRDQQALGYLNNAYGDSGVLARLAEKDPDLAESVRKSLGLPALRKGGKLSKNMKRGRLAC